MRTKLYLSVRGRILRRRGIITAGGGQITGGGSI